MTSDRHLNVIALKMGLHSKLPLASSLLHIVFLFLFLFSEVKLDAVVVFMTPTPLNVDRAEMGVCDPRSTGVTGQRASGADAFDSNSPRFTNAAFPSELSFCRRRGGKRSLWVRRAWWRGGGAGRRGGGAVTPCKSMSTYWSITGS